MGEREELVQVIKARLERLSDDGLASVLDPALLAQAAALFRLLRDDDGDIHARYVLGWLHWFRFHALPEGEGGQDLSVAVLMLTPCFACGVGNLPEPLLPIMAEQAAPPAIAMLERVLASPDPTLLGGTLDLWRAILNATSTDHPDRAMYLNNLGVALALRFERSGDQSDLDERIEIARQAVAATSADHPERAIYLTNLGKSLNIRFERNGDQSDLNEMIEVARQAVAATSADDPSRATRLHNLRGSLRARYERTGDRADLNEAIEAARQAVAAVPAHHPDHAMYSDRLGDLLRIRVMRTERQADPDEAIEAAREMAALTPAGHPEHAMVLDHLGNMLRTRFERSGHRADADASVAAGRQAVAATADRLDRALCLCNLGGALVLRSELTGDQADLEEAIEIERQAVADIPDRHADRAISLSGLGAALLRRFERSGDRPDLDEAIETLRQAVAATDGHPDLGMFLSNLGAALSLRFERTQNQDDLDEAIETLRQAVTLSPADHPNQAMFLNNLGNALRSRFERTESPLDLNEAIETLRQAVTLSPVDHPNRAMYLNNLGNALRSRFERTQDRDDLDEAIEVTRQAAAATHPDQPNLAMIQSNLGTALVQRYVLTQDQADLDEAAAVYEQAFELRSSPPSVRVRAAKFAAYVAAASDPGRAADLLEGAVRLLPEVAPRYLERADQQHAIGRFSGLATTAAAFALTDPDAPADRAAARALSLLEAARAVLLSQALHTRSDLTDLRERHPDLADRFTRLRDLLDSPADAAPSPPTGGEANPNPASAEHAARDRRRLAAEFADVLADIRALDDFASFALPPTTEELLAQARSGPVVVFNVGAHRSDALLLTGDGVAALPLPALTPDAVAGRVTDFHDALRIITDREVPRKQRMEAQPRVRQTLEWLWDVAAEPVLRALGYDRPPEPGQEWPRVWWVPGGRLGLLPVHAAGHHTDPPGEQRRTVMDRVISSYTPTIGALSHARRRIDDHLPRSDRTLVVAMPTTPGLPKEGRLPNVPDEVKLLRSRLPRLTLLADLDSDIAPTAGPATKANVLVHLPDATIAHFACHGHLDPADPSRSRLLLRDHQDDPLSVAGLAPIALEQARLAYLSACGTATTADSVLLDEAIHLASAFQLVGFPHVVGTLWDINDQIAVEITESFYAGLAAEENVLDTGRAAHALHHAVRTVRDRYPATPSLWAAHIHVGA
ncbi:CHAT domain-containing protein [Nonomuraea sp. NPDC004702]